MMSTHQRLAILAGIMLSSCTGQPSPIIPTQVTDVTPTLSTTAATSDTILSFTNTPHPIDNTPVNTQGPEQGVMTTQVPTLDVNLSVSQTNNNDSTLIIPDTGSSPTSTNDGKPDKFHDFAVPVSGENAFFLVPATGFPKGVQSVVKPQPANLQYFATDVTLEIPSLGVNIPVMGIPKQNQTWDVSWLSDQAGWLEGTAFPSWNGNSILTAHFYMASGLPGPFVNLSTMGYGDKIIVHSFGQKNIFEVQTNEDVEPNDQTVLKHEEKSWLTLITCAEYVAETATYNKRTVVRAVLVAVENQ